MLDHVTRLQVYISLDQMVNCYRLCTSPGCSIYCHIFVPDNLRQPISRPVVAGVFTSLLSGVRDNEI